MSTAPGQTGATQARETVAYHLCSGTRFEPFLERRGFIVARCADCGLYYVNPQPNSYELEQIHFTYDSGEQRRQGEEYFIRAVARPITRLKCSGLALDVGTGSGNFLRAIRSAIGRFPIRRRSA